MYTFLLKHNATGKLETKYNRNERQLAVYTEGPFSSDFTVLACSYSDRGGK